MADTSPNRLSSRWREEDGASLGEYALVLGVVSVVFFVVLVSFRGSIGNLITRSTTALASNAETGAPTGSTGGGTTSGGTAGSGSGGSPGQSGLAPGQGGSGPPGLGGNGSPGQSGGGPPRGRP